MEIKANKVPFVCPACHHKTTGIMREDGAIVVVCHRCQAKVFSKRHNKEVLIKITMK